MARGDPRPEPSDQVNNVQRQGIVIKTQVMDMHLDDENEAVSLTNHCYTSDTYTTLLEPESSATYASRWMYGLVRPTVLSIAVANGVGH